MYNGWGEEDSLAHLRASLTGMAAQVLWDVGHGALATYSLLVDKLRQRFGSAGQMERYRSELRSRRRNKNESLQALYQDIRRLMIMAYPGSMDERMEDLAKDYFISALNDRDFEMQIKQREPKDLDAAFRLAERLEGYEKVAASKYDDRRGNRQLREIASDPQVKELQVRLQQSDQQVKELSAQVADLTNLQRRKQSKEAENNTNVPGDGNSSKEAEETTNGNCFNCGEAGHWKKDCPKRSSRRGRRQYPSARTLNDRQSNSGRHSTRKRGRHFLRTTIGRTEVYLPARVFGQTRMCLLDTGCDISILREKMIGNRHMRPSDKKIFAANQTEVKVLGELDVDLRIGGKSFQFPMLVSDHVTETMLGYDWLSHYEVV